MRVSASLFYTKKTRCQGTPIKTIHSVVLETRPGLWYWSLTSPLHVASSDHDSSHYLLPTHQPQHWQTSLTAPLSASVFHFLTVIPALSQPKHESLISLIRADVSAQPGLSQSDAPFWQHIVGFIRGKNLSRSFIFVKEEGWMWCCYLSRLEVERLTGWDKATETRRRLVEYIKRRDTRGLTQAERKLVQRSAFQYVVTVRSSQSVAKYPAAHRPHHSLCETVLYTVSY